jgi:hypothetical protein
VIAGVMLFVSLHVLSWVVVSLLAARRGRRPWAWFCLALAFGWFAVILLLSVGGSAKKTCPQCAERVNAEARVCWYCGASLEGVESADMAGWITAVRVLGVAAAGSLVLLIVGVAGEAASSHSSNSVATISITVPQRTQRHTVSAAAHFHVEVPRYDLNNQASFGFQEGYRLPPLTKVVLTVSVANRCHVHSFSVRALSGTPDASLTVVGNGGRFVEGHGDHSTVWDNSTVPAGSAPFSVAIRIVNDRAHLPRRVWVEYAGCYPS